MPPHNLSPAIRPILRNPRTHTQCLRNHHIHHHPDRVTIRPSASSPRSMRPPPLRRSYANLPRHDESILNDHLDAVSLHRLEAAQRQHYKRRSYYMATGALLSMLATLALVSFVEIPMKPDQAEAPDSSPLRNLDARTPVTVVSEQDESVEQVPTGTSTIPTFPKKISPRGIDPSAAGTPTEYQLMGVGVRTVSFLSIQVYVVGLYIATDDIAALQAALVRTQDPVATALIPAEKATLREKLLDPAGSEAIWGAVLRDPGIRVLVRVVPTRTTDFGHLRDGWVRGITARSQAGAKSGAPEFSDPGFGQSLGDFKACFSAGGRKSVPKGRTLLLARGKEGGLSIWFDQGLGQKKDEELVLMGEVADERVGRCLLLNYLAGQYVASEGARQSVVDGVMEFVERPIGTVAAQVV